MLSGNEGANGRINHGECRREMRNATRYIRRNELLAVRYNFLTSAALPEQQEQQLRVRDDFQLFVNGKTQTRPQNMLLARLDAAPPRSSTRIMIE